MNNTKHAQHHVLRLSPARSDGPRGSVTYTCAARYTYCTKSRRVCGRWTMQVHPRCTVSELYVQSRGSERERERDSEDGDGYRTPFAKALMSGCFDGRVSGQCARVQQGCPAEAPLESSLWCLNRGHLWTATDGPSVIDGLFYWGDSQHVRVCHAAWVAPESVADPMKART
jgi:hypothetical protein